MPRSLPIRWGDYEQCPVCFRSYDCRSMRRYGRVLWRMGQTWRSVTNRTTWWTGPARRVMGLPAGWDDRTLSRPHPGRRMRSGVIK